MCSFIYYYLIDSVVSCSISVGRDQHERSDLFLNMSSGSTNKTSVPDTDKWGYVVCFGTVITFIAGIGQVNSFGLIFKDFIIETHSSAKWIAIAHGIFSIMLAVGGLILNVVSKKYSLRIGGFIGAVIMSVGSFLTLLITNTNQIPLTFGIFQGIGFGMIVPVCYSTLNHYFGKKKTQTMSLVKAIQGVILIWYPQIIKDMLSYYGFRSTLLIISGISLHIFPGLATMKINKHSKRPANINLSTNQKNKENIGLICDHETSQIHDKYIKEDKKSLAAFGNIVLEVLNIKVLKDPIFCNISVGQSFVNFSDLLFFILEPMLLFQYGFDTSQVAACISISAGADVAGRFLLAAISSTVTINTRLLFFVSTLFTLAGRIVILQVRQFIWVALVTSLLGVLRAWLHIASPLVIADHIPHEVFTAAYAVFMLTSGIVNAVMSPIIGLTKELHQDYIPAFYALSACCAPCLLLWPMEYYIRAYRKKNNEQRASTNIL